MSPIASIADHGQDNLRGDQQCHKRRAPIPPREDDPSSDHPVHDADQRHNLGDEMAPLMCTSEPSPVQVESMVATMMVAIAFTKAIGVVRHHRSRTSSSRR